MHGMVEQRRASVSKGDVDAAAFFEGIYARSLKIAREASPAERTKYFPGMRFLHETVLPKVKGRRMVFPRGAFVQEESTVVPVFDPANEYAMVDLLQAPFGRVVRYVGDRYFSSVDSFEKVSERAGVSEETVLAASDAETVSDVSTRDWLQVVGAIVLAERFSRGEQQEIPLSQQPFAKVIGGFLQEEGMTAQAITETTDFSLQEAQSILSGNFAGDMPIGLLKKIFFHKEVSQITNANETLQAELDRTRGALQEQRDRCEQLKNALTAREAEIPAVTVFARKKLETFTQAQEMTPEQVAEVLHIPPELLGGDTSEAAIQVLDALFKHHEQQSSRQDSPSVQEVLASILADRDLAQEADAVSGGRTLSTQLLHLFDAFYPIVSQMPNHQLRQYLPMMDRLNSIIGQVKRNDLPIPIFLKIGDPRAKRRGQRK